ncbi:MAG: hypothetical protein IJT39_01820 [Bacteroidales bacterium]|nr:hypothetical protein [Bacteroidales bacterium]
MRAFLLLGLSLLCAITLWAQQPLLTHSADGKLQQSQHDIYDSHDRLAVRIVYTYDDSTGAVESRSLTGYDRQGRIQRVEVYSADERLLFTDTYHYRRNGTLRKRVQCSYDENGQLIDKQTIKPSTH